MRYFMGLDIGTSGTKALLIDEKGAVRAAATALHPLSTPEPGWAEQRPEDWWKSSIRAMKQLFRTAKVKPSLVASVGISGQMHSAVFLDKKLAVIRPALLWCDGRTTDECRRITATIGERRLREWVQNPALEGFTLPKVLWVAAHEPAAFARLDKVVLAKDYIRLRLTGTLASEPSDASATLMYDGAKRQWSRDVMDAMGLAPSLLPDVGESAEILGKVNAEAARATGLARDTPVMGGGADNACGALGVGLVEPGEAVASWGTSGTVLTPMREPLVDDEMRAHTFCHAAPGIWYMMGVMLTAGGAFAWHTRELARELSKKKDSSAVLNREADGIAPGAEGLTFLPYLQGERTPHRDASARGAFVGLTLAHARAHLSRAVIEGICFGMRDSLSIVRRLAPVNEVLVTGGGAKSKFIRKMQADVYGLPVVRVNREEGPAYGAALLAAVGVGAFADVAAACRKTIKRLPAEPFDAAVHRAYDAPYDRFRRLYPALRSLLEQRATA
jgi:xylulokinase